MLSTFLLAVICLSMLGVGYVVQWAMWQAQKDVWKDARVQWSWLIQNLRSSELRVRRWTWFGLAWAAFWLVFWGWVFFKILEGASSCCAR